MHAAARCWITFRSSGSSRFMFLDGQHRMRFTDYSLLLRRSLPRTPSRTGDMLEAFSMKWISSRHAMTDGGFGCHGESMTHYSLDPFNERVFDSSAAF